MSLNGEKQRKPVEKGVRRCEGIGRGSGQPGEREMTGEEGAAGYFSRSQEQKLSTRHPQRLLIRAMMRGGQNKK